jgi:hypothetical protein
MVVNEERAPFAPPDCDARYEWSPCIPTGFASERYSVWKGSPSVYATWLDFPWRQFAVSKEPSVIVWFPLLSIGRTSNR